MKNIFSITIGILCIVILALFAGTFIDVNLQIQNAREYHNAVVERVQASDYNETIINQCIIDGSAYGYSIEILNTSIYTYHKDYYVSLAYPIRVLLFDHVSSGVIEGYAR